MEVSVSGPLVKRIKKSKNFLKLIHNLQFYTFRNTVNAIPNVVLFTTTAEPGSVVNANGFGVTQRAAQSTGLNHILTGSFTNTQIWRLHILVEAQLTNAEHPDSRVVTVAPPETH